VLYKADGSKFTGLVQIAWTSFEAADHSNITTHNLTVRIVDGALKVKLVPTTNSTPAAYYSVKYNSDGKVQFQETWAVPPSSLALRIRDVRVSAPGEIGNDTGGPLEQSDVVGLTADLAARPLKSPGYVPNRAVFVNSQGALEGVSGSISDCVRVDGSSGPCGGGNASETFIDSETPTGQVDGSNATFVVSSAPSPASSLAVYRNGLRMKAGFDYTASGQSITFVPEATPQTGDTLLASYRLSSGSSGGTPYFGPQVLCSGVGAITNLTNDTSLGTCTVASGLLTPGDRVEVRFAFEHLGSASGFHFDVKWGATYALQRDGSGSDALVSGRTDAVVLADSAQIDGQSWGTVLPLASSVALAPDSGTNGVVIEVLGRLANAAGDRLALRNFTVIRFP
jgi:hypothetical protein